MTQVTQRVPASPRQASRRRAPIDRSLDTDLFKALADPTRAKLLACLMKCARACSVSEVAECCSVDFSVVARHLALLARAGVLDASKQGRTMWYSPRPQELAARLRVLADAIEACSPACAPASDANCCNGGDCCG